MKKINWNIDIEKERIKNHKDNVVIVGAGNNAKIILSWLKDILDTKKVYILDNNIEKAGSTLDFFEWSIDIMRVDTFFEEKTYSDYIFIVSPDNNYLDIESQLYSYDSALDLLCWARREYTAGDYFERRIIDSIIEIESRYDCFVQDKRELRYEIMQNKKIIIPQVILVLGNICNLQCKKCSMLMPYMKNKFNVSVDEAKKEIDSFLGAVDEVVSFNLIAGETLIYPNIADIIEYLIPNPKVKLITMASNSFGELTERTINSLKNSKVLVLLSDYGQVEQIGKKIALFEKNNIRFKVVSEQKWVDFGDMNDRKKTPEEMGWAYTRCFAGDICHAIYDGKLWVCERSARMYMIDQEYGFKSDYIDLYDPSLRNKLSGFLLQKSALSCNYCSACSEDAEVIEAGEQLNGSIIRSNYTFIQRRDMK